MADGKLHNWDFVGRCYDVLKVDPLNIEAGGKLPQAFQMSDFDDIADGRFQKPACTEHIPATGGRRESTTVSLSSSYDFHTLNKRDASVTVSDPTGELFATSLSSSYSQTRDATESRKSVVTLTGQTVNAYKLSLRSDKGALQVSSFLADVVQKLPVTAAPDYDAFVGRFGTHYARSVLFGGRIYQRITVEQSKYSTFLEEGIDVQAEAKATFEIAKGSISGHMADTRNEKFVSATKNSSESIVWAGGVPDDINSWTRSVADQPAPIQVELCPLYDLLTDDLFPKASGLEQKKGLLKAATESYIRSRGDDASTTLLKYRDTVALGLVGARDSRQRFLSATKASYARTSLQENQEQTDHLQWTIVNADDPAKQGDVRDGDIVALRSARTDRYLDAQAGTDSTYERGVGLTAATGESPRVAATRWKITLTERRARTEIVKGDYVRFQSEWRDPDGHLGYLQGEVNFDDQAQRVYAFGRSSPPRGTIWRVGMLPMRTQ